MKPKCKNCKYFKRLKWIKVLDQNEKEQRGGTCKVLKDILGMTNSQLWFSKSIHVQESFRCAAFKEGK